MSIDRASAYRSCRTTFDASTPGMAPLYTQASTCAVLTDASRVGVIFVFQNRLIRLFSWKKPPQTLSFLAIYSFICLDPSLLAVLPVAGCLFFVMIPAFLARHPPPPPGDLPTDYYPLQGPPLAPPQSITPAPELSKDFFRNMRDLQNSMEDFSVLHDTLIAWLAPPTNFSNEALSSAIFLFLFILACVLFITAHLLPWRLILLLGGWMATCAGHPSFQSILHSAHADELLEKQDIAARSSLLSFAATDVDLSSAPETREVEVFELQRRAGGRPGLHVSDMEIGYEPFMFSPEPYTPLSRARIAGERPRGTRFFEDVQPPKGWRWADKKWILDFLSREWVEERCITGVEVEVEGERWVSDIKYKEGDSGGNAEDTAQTTDGRRKRKEKAVTWEEGNGTKKGEWRRRRWVRVVERKGMTDDGR